jgi:hypothetical protein
MDFKMKLAPRLPDWRTRLEDYLARVAGQPFRPGRHDCALFVAGAVEAMTGEDPAAAWRGAYRSLDAGQDALQAAGFADHVALVAAACEEVPPALAAVGDIAVLPGAGKGAALGLVQGAAVYVLHPGGLGLVNRLHVERAFRV